MYSQSYPVMLACVPSKRRGRRTPSLALPCCFDARPLEIIDAEGRDLTPNAQMLKRILAVLLLDDNRQVGIHEFVDELWGVDPSATAVQTRQTYLLGVRRHDERSVSSSPCPRWFGCTHRNR